MQGEKYKTGNKTGNVSDAELDALLAEWAESEIEPPAGFHEETMKRLRAEAQPKAEPKTEKKKNNIVTLFAKNKRWTSIAAAAVLMLFCVPVVNGQLGGDATNKVPDGVQAQQLQVAQDISNARMMNSEDADTEVQPKNNAAEKQDMDTTADDSQTGNKTVMSSAEGTAPETGNDDIIIEYAAGVEDPANVPMMASLGDEGVVNSNTRTTAFDSAANEKTLEELETELAELQKQLAEYQAQLDAAPDDTNLQLIVAEQQKAIEDVKEKIEELKKVETE